MTASPEPSNVTYPFTLNASLIPSNPADTLSGTVTFSLDGAVVGAAPISANTASMNLSGISVAAGTHSLSASWPGDSTYPPLTLSGSHTVSLLPLTISLAANPTSLSSGVPVTAATTFTPALLPNQTGDQFIGTMALSDNGIVIAQQQVSRDGFSFTIPSLTPGTHILSVAYPGDPLFSAAQSNSVTVTVVGAPTTSTLIATPATAAYGAPVTLTANIAAVTSAGSAVPTGTVVFMIDGQPLPPVPLVNAAAATVLSNLALGTHSVSCTYSGDNTFASSICNTVSVAITPAASAISITSSQNPSLAYTPVTFTIHLTVGNQPAPAGSQFTFSLMSNSSNVLLTTDANGTASYTTSQLFARTWDITAMFAGGNFVTSVAHYSQVVTAIPTTLSLTASPNPADSGQTVNFMASATPSGTNFPTGTVTFLEGVTVLGTGTLTSTGQAIFSTSTLTVGAHTIVATYSGDLGFLPTTSPALSVTILPQSFVLSTSTPTLSIPTEHYKSFSASVQSVGGFTGSVQLTCAVPQNVYLNCDISHSGLQLAVNGSATSNLTLDTDALLHFESASESGTRHTVFGSGGTALALLLPLPLGFLIRRRGLRVLPLTLLLFAVGAALSVTGCGDKYAAHTPPGNYDIVITAIGTATGSNAATAQTVHMQLTVTPE